MLKTDSPSLILGNIYPTPVHPIAVGMMFMRTILALTLAAFALAAPVAHPQEVNGVGNFEILGNKTAQLGAILGADDEDVTVGDRSG